MTRHSRIMTCLITAAALGIGLASYQFLGLPQTQAQAPGKAPKTAVAVVNVADLINKCDKNKDFTAEVQRRIGKIQQESEEKQKKIKTMQLELDVIADAQQRTDKERQIIRAIAEFRAWQQIEQEYIARDQRLNLIDLYGDIDKTVAAVAQREGYDLVLFSTPTPDFSQLNPDQLIQVISNRRVIYQTDRVDLTKIVLEQMNLDYINRGGQNN